jgi:histidine triad (HIT) family protein
LFCKIAGGDIPSDEVASSAQTYAFRDLNPQAPTHVLVIPRDHIADADHVRPEHAGVLAEMLTTAQEVARKDGLDGGYRLVLNVGDDAGQTVLHMHLHVLGGRRMGWPPG